MKCIYIDNFRGFSDTIIPLKSVNFFVGENSTGKTSILALINLLSSPDFWLSQNFNLEEYEFGGFQDIVSINSNKDKEFSFGLYQSFRSKKDNKLEKVCYLISYREMEGLPAVSFFSKFEEGRIINLRFHKNTQRFLIKNIPDEKKEDNPELLFSMLKKNKDIKIIKYKQFPKKFPAKGGLIPVLSIIDSVITDRKIDKSLENLHIKMFPLPLFFYDLTWFAPIRTKPRRTYDGYGKHFSPDGEHTPYLLRKRLLSKTEAETFKISLENFGKASGLFKEVTIKELGSEATSPFELLILLAENPLRINCVGYGVSQSLPLIVEMLTRPKNSWFAIQQPEVHLHPKAQAALGDLIFEMAENNGKHFLIETHSDYTIDRFRLNYKNSKHIKTLSQIVYFERTDKGNKISIIPILKNGEYSSDQPDSFRDFFVKEQMELLGI